MNSERILGQLLRVGVGGNGRRTGGLNLGGKAGLGMGVLGLAFAAFEHFSQQSPRREPQRDSATGGPKPPPTPISATASPSPSTPPPLPPATHETAASKEDAELLIRAMIAAAHADGLIDHEEEQRILDAARDGGVLTDEELSCLESEINRPRTMFEIVAGVTSVELARQVYAVSLLAVEVDTEHEKNYLRQLASSLHLSEDEVAQIERDLGVSL